VNFISRNALRFISSFRGAEAFQARQRISREAALRNLSTPQAFQARKCTKGTQYWNRGRTREIQDKVLHL
jgi:hypothetical protein